MVVQLPTEPNQFGELESNQHRLVQSETTIAFFPRFLGVSCNSPPVLPSNLYQNLLHSTWRVDIFVSIKTRTPP